MVKAFFVINIIALMREEIEAVVIWRKKTRTKTSIRYAKEKRERRKERERKVEGKI